MGGDDADPNPESFRSRSSAHGETEGGVEEGVEEEGLAASGKGKVKVTDEVNIQVKVEVRSQR